MSLLEEIALTCGPLPGKLLAGFSGGCDSTALVMVLLTLREKGLVDFGCVHVNHGLRQTADRDQAFVEEFCREHGLKLYVYRAHPGSDRSEAWARETRYAFFREAMAASSSDALVLAHHRDDQAETVLMHLMRGSGLEGLTGMRRETVQGGMRILRPLLKVPRSLLQEALEEAGAVWQEDETNAEDTYLRNRVRHELLPLMERLQKGAGAHIADCALRLQEDADLISSLSEKALQPGATCLSLEALGGMPRGMKARLLRKAFENAAGEMQERSLPDRHTRALLKLLSEPAGSRLQLPGNVTACRGYRFVHMLPPHPELPPDPVPLADGVTFLGLRFSVSGEAGNGDGIRCQRLKRENLIIRVRQAGDYIRPFGMQGRKSLQDYLTDRRVDQPFRDRIPLICRGREVLVVCGVGAGDVEIQDTKDTQTDLYTWEGPMAWM